MDNYYDSIIISMSNGYHAFQKTLYYGISVTRVIPEDTDCNKIVSTFIKLRDNNIVFYLFSRCYYSFPTEMLHVHTW